MPRSNETVTLTYLTQTGAELPISFPAAFEVCARCDGHGRHVNPAVDGNGISREEFDNDPDFFEDYMSGVYDVQCSVCQGQRVTLEVDLDRCTKRQQAKFDRISAQQLERDQERAADRQTMMRESGNWDGGY